MSDVWCNTENLRWITYDGVVLEERVVALAAADLEDELTDVKQVVAADAQLEKRQEKRDVTPDFSHCFGTISGLFWTTHGQAQLGDVQVELHRVEVYEAEQRPQDPRPPLTAPAEHVGVRQAAVETAAQVAQPLHRAAWHHREADIRKEKKREKSCQVQDKHVKH